MIHIEDEIFIKKKFDFDKLKSFGFSIVDNKYIYTEDFLDANFKAIAFPIPLAAPVMSATFPSNSFIPFRF